MVHSVGILGLERQMFEEAEFLRAELDGEAKVCENCLLGLEDVVAAAEFALHWEEALVSAAAAASFYL